MMSGILLYSFYFGSCVHKNIAKLGKNEKRSILVRGAKMGVLILRFPRPG